MSKVVQPDVQSGSTTTGGCTITIVSWLWPDGSLSLSVTTSTASTVRVLHRVSLLAVTAESASLAARCRCFDYSTQQAVYLFASSRLHVIVAFSVVTLVSL
jgi:hypothetical protein